VLVPVAAYLAGQVKGALDLVSQAVSLLEGAWSSMGSALDAVWRNVIAPLVAFLVDQVLATLRSVSEGARAMAEVFAGAFRAIYDAALSFLKPVLDLVHSVVSGIQEAFSWLHRQLVGGSIVPEMWEGVVSWTEWGVSEVVGSIDRLARSLEGFGGARTPSSRSIAISLTLNVTSGPSGTTGWGAVAEAVSRELVRRLRYLV
jgi:phage-related protein